MLENDKMSRILGIPLEVTVVIGRCKMTLKELLEIKKGRVIELDNTSSEDIELHINGKKIAFGKTVYVDQSFGVQITEVLDESELIQTLM